MVHHRRINWAKMPEQIPECTTTAWEENQKQPFGNIDNNKNQEKQQQQQQTEEK